MIWIITAVTFLGTLALLAAIIYAFAPTKATIASRLSRIAGGPVGVEEISFMHRQKDRVRDSLAELGRILPAVSTQGVSRTKLMIIRAGYRDPEAIQTIRGLKLLFPIAVLAAVFFSGLYRYNPFLILVGAVMVGYLVPDLWLTWRVSVRQKQLRRALPDALDLLVVCVEAGLGLDQAIMKVAEELRISHPELSEELRLVNLEMRVGKSRVEALHELGRRTGLDDIKSLVAMLVQTERFGTSVAQSLRVFADDMRVQRRQRAEEQSAKATIKMVPPLVFFIFPALLVVLLGPAFISIYRQLVQK